MLVAERYENIVRIVNERGSSRVTELSEIFSVTEETIRRDLAFLENQGRLRRSHGGAVSVKMSQSEVSYLEREITNIEEKRKIAKAAAEFIELGDSIILDASSTAGYMAELLPDIKLTVLTNSIKVATSLAAKEQIQVISTGGILSPRSLSYVGPLTEKTLDQYHVNKTFLSCKGIHPEKGVSESNELQARVKQRMIEISDRVYMLVDFSKFGLRAFSKVADADQVDVIICDDKAPEAMTAELRKQQIEIVKA